MCKSVGVLEFGGVTGELVIHRDGSWGITVDSLREDGVRVFEEVRFSVSPENGETMSDSQFLGEADHEKLFNY